MQAVIDRHDVLRTAVLWEQLPRPVQVVYRQATLPVEEVTLDPQRDALEQVQRMARAAAAAAGSATGAADAPAQLPTIARRACWYALLQLHHIVADNTSREIIC